jgi:hypothetical protein
MMALSWWGDAAVVAEARPEGRAGAAIAACTPVGYPGPDGDVIVLVYG